MAEFRAVVRRRRMVRRYLPDPVDPAVLHRILDVARRGPSAGFSQGQSFVVVTDATLRRRIAAVCDEPAYLARGFDAWLSVAPVHVLLCTSPQAYRDRYAAADKSASEGPDGWEVPFWWVDGGAALLLLLLAAVDEGLAAGFQQVPQGPVTALLDLAPHELPVGLVTLGHAHPGERRSGSLARGRRPFDDAVRFVGPAPP